jgi:hypothetical protein
LMVKRGSRTDTFPVSKNTPLVSTLFFAWDFVRR